MPTKLHSTASISTVVLPVVVTTDTSVAVVGRKRGPVCAVDKVFLQLSRSGAVCVVGAWTIVSNSIVDDLIFGCREIKACRLTDHALRCSCRGPIYFSAGLSMIIGETYCKAPSKPYSTDCSPNYYTIQSSDISTPHRSRSCIPADS